jgi:hypothetical protein
LNYFVTIQQCHFCVTRPREADYEWRCECRRESRIGRTAENVSFLSALSLARQAVAVWRQAIGDQRANAVVRHFRRRHFPEHLRSTPAGVARALAAARGHAQRVGRGIRAVSRWNQREARVVRGGSVSRTVPDWTGDRPGAVGPKGRVGRAPRNRENWRRRVFIHSGGADARVLGGEIRSQLYVRASDTKKRKCLVLLAAPRVVARADNDVAGAGERSDGNEDERGGSEMRRHGLRAIRRSATTRPARSTVHQRGQNKQRYYNYG